MIVLTETFQIVPRRVLVEDWMGERLVTFWYGWWSPEPTGTWQPRWVLQRKGRLREVWRVEQPWQDLRVHKRAVLDWITKDDRSRRLGTARLPTLVAAEMYIRAKGAVG